MYSTITRVIIKFRMKIHIMCINHNDKRIMRTCTLYNRIIDNLTSENKSLMLIKFTKVEVVFELMRHLLTLMAHRGKETIVVISSNQQVF